MHGSHQFCCFRLRSCLRLLTLCLLFYDLIKYCEDYETCRSLSKVNLYLLVSTDGTPNSGLSSTIRGKNNLYQTINRPIADVLWFENNRCTVTSCSMNTDEPVISHFILLVQIKWTKGRVIMVSLLAGSISPLVLTVLVLSFDLVLSRVFPLPCTHNADFISLTPTLLARVRSLREICFACCTRDTLKPHVSV